jgi:SAM-dependent methyltransferase
MPQATYDKLGQGYAQRRQPDPHIAAAIWSALGPSRTVINVGAGTGSYEPSDRLVLAVEPSELMISQRLPHAAPCVRGLAEALPVKDGAYESATAVLTIHHWSDWRLGLRELRRVARDRIVVLTFDAEASNFWPTRDYFPEILERDREIMPPLRGLAEELSAAEVTPVPVPHDCLDGFFGAYWRRPEVYLDQIARRSMSPFSKIEAEKGLTRLTEDLDSGVWRKRYADILSLDALDVGYRLLSWNFGGK